MSTVFFKFDIGNSVTPVEPDSRGFHIGHVKSMTITKKGKIVTVYWTTGLKDISFLKEPVTTAIERTSVELESNLRHV